jgi:hypothetical protein
MSYSIELAAQSKKKHQTTSLHLITGFALLGIGGLSFLVGDAQWIKTVFHATIIPITLLATLSFMNGLLVLYLVFFKGQWLKGPANNKIVRVAHVVDASLLSILFLLSQWWLAAGITAVLALANAYAIFHEQKLNEILLIHIEETGILLPHNARRKQLQWSEIERVILRHGNLTIDTTDNFLYQWPFKKSTIAIDEIEAFCLAKIKDGMSKRLSNDW